MTAFSSETEFVVSPDVASADVGRETVLLDARSGTYFSLDSVGRRVWRLVESPVAFSKIHAAIVRQFDVAPDVARSDLQKFLGALTNHGLVRMSPVAEAVSVVPIAQAGKEQCDGT
jgi:hypothetical protein